VQNLTDVRTTPLVCKASYEDEEEEIEDSEEVWGEDDDVALVGCPVFGLLSSVKWGERQSQE
jgi:hypothetical protein